MRLKAQLRHSFAVQEYYFNFLLSNGSKFRVLFIFKVSKPHCTRESMKTYFVFFEKPVEIVKNKNNEAAKIQRNITSIIRNIDFVFLLNCFKS